jgi:putative oxidoreductase
MNVAMGLLVLRVLAGIGILTHGIAKVRDLKGTQAWMRSIGFPSIAGIVAAFVETLGGILLILGVATQWVALALLINMFGALFYHLREKQSFKQMEDAYLYATIFLVLALAGGGAWQLFSLALF